MSPQIAEARPRFSLYVKWIRPNAAGIWQGKGKVCWDNTEICMLLDSELCFRDMFLLCHEPLFILILPYPWELIKMLPLSCLCYKKWLSTWDIFALLYLRVAILQMVAGNLLGLHLISIILHWNPSPHHRLHPKISRAVNSSWVAQLVNNFMPVLYVSVGFWSKTPFTNLFCNESYFWVIKYICPPPPPAFYQVLAFS